MPTAPPAAAADLFSLKKSCKIEQEVVIFVGYSRHSEVKNDIHFEVVNDPNQVSVSGPKTKWYSSQFGDKLFIKYVKSCYSQ